MKSPFLTFSNPTSAPQAFVDLCLDYPDQFMMFEVSPIEMTPTRFAVLLQLSGLVNQSITYRSPSGDPMEPWHIYTKAQLENSVKVPIVGTCHDIAATKRKLLMDDFFFSGEIVLAEVIPPEFPNEHHLIDVVRTTKGDIVLDQICPGQAPIWYVRNYKWIRVQSFEVSGEWLEVV